MKGNHAILKPNPARMASIGIRKSKPEEFSRSAEGLNRYPLHKASEIAEIFVEPTMP